MEEYYNFFLANHAQALKAKDYDPSLEYFTVNFSDSVEEHYYDSKGKFNKIIFDLEHSHALSPTIRQFFRLVHLVIIIHPQKSLSSPVSTWSGKPTVTYS